MDRLLGAASAAVAVASNPVIALVQAAGRRVGIEGRHVVQAVVVPRDMAAVPRRAGGLVGVFTHAAQLVPVVRLEDWLEASTDVVPDPAALAASPEARIVILGDGERIVGLLVDAVVGMQRCAPDAVARLFHDDRPDELFAGAVRIAGEAAPVPLLEPARLAAIAGTWCAAAGIERANADVRPTTAPIAPTDLATERVSLGVLRIGDVRIAIDVTDIGELVRTPALRPPPLRHPSSRGLCDWRGRLLPVVDIAGLLGALPAGEAPAWMCVVRHGGLVLGVLVHEIVELHAADVPRADAGHGEDLVRCELPTARGILQLLDTAALMARCPESGISLRREADARSDAAATSPHTWLVFEAGGCYATRIECVQEIVPLPPELRPRLDAGLPVSLPWRGDAVPVRGLFADPAHTVAARDARLLIVVVADGCRVAIPIASVKAMIAPRTSTISRLRVRDELVDVISTVAVADRASYEVVDLAARAAAGRGARGEA